MNPRRRRLARQRRKDRRAPWRHVRVTLGGLPFELVPFRATWRKSVGGMIKGHIVALEDIE